MFDYVLQFQDQPTAQADPVVGQYWRAGSGNNPGSWRGDCVIPGIEVWSPANDTTGTTQGPNGPVTTVTHTYLPGWWLVIAKTARDPNLDNHSALILVADRNAANTGQPASSFILKANETVAQLQTYLLQPVFAGSNYPFS